MLALEASESYKKKDLMFGDVYGVMTLAKELEMEKCRPIQLRLQLPDFRQPVKVS